jgi:hypothetical protein
VKIRAIGGSIFFYIDFSENSIVIVLRDKQFITGTISA